MGQLTHTQKGRAPYHRLLSLDNLAFIIFIVTIFIVHAFHEPWYDEAQAWQIARCASLREMLFEIPHYEGHPPLWWLALAPLAKSGVPFEEGLKLVGFVTASAIAWLLLFRSPFPRPVRLLLPFNYFVFYQYGVIVRPYSVLLLLALIIAISFPTKEIHPVRFCVLLFALCLTHAYGMLIACGVALAWTWDLAVEKGPIRLVRELVYDKRTRLLLVLLALGVLCALQIMPRADTYDPSSVASRDVWSRTLFTVLCAPLECLLTCSSWLANDRADLQGATIPAADLFANCLLGAIFWVAMYAISSRKNFKYLIIPHALVAGFGGIVYMAAHHLGVFLSLLLFWLWVDLEDDHALEGWEHIRDVMGATKRETNMVAALGKAFAAACLAISVTWTVVSCYKEINEVYGPGRAFVSFLRSTGLEESLAFDAWYGTRGSGSSQSLNTLMFNDFPSTYAYFDRGIYANVPTGYQTYRLATDAQNEESRRRWRELGLPDLLVSDVDLAWVFGDDTLTDRYAVVYLMESDHIWKGRDNRIYSPVYLRNDLFDAYALTPLELTPEQQRQVSGSVEITEETMEALRNGELGMEEFLDGLGL